MPRFALKLVRRVADRHVRVEDLLRVEALTADREDRARRRVSVGVHTEVKSRGAICICSGEPDLQIRIGAIRMHAETRSYTIGESELHDDIHDPVVRVVQAHSEVPEELLVDGRDAVCRFALRGPRGSTVGIDDVGHLTHARGLCRGHEWSGAVIIRVKRDSRGHGQTLVFNSAVV